MGEGGGTGLRIGGCWHEWHRYREVMMELFDEFSCRMQRPSIIVELYVALELCVATEVRSAIESWVADIVR